MSTVSLSEFRAFIREVQDNALDPVLQLAIDAAEEHVETFIGFPLIEFDGDVPAAIKQCVCALAMISTDDMTPERESQVRDRVENALRPYRRETGMRAA